MSLMNKWCLNFGIFCHFTIRLKRNFPLNLYAEKEKNRCFAGRAYFVWLHLVVCAIFNLDKIGIQFGNNIQNISSNENPTNSVFWASFQFRVQIHVVTSKWHSNWILFNPEYYFYFPIPTKKSCFILRETSIQMKTPKIRAL